MKLKKSQRNELISGLLFLTPNLLGFIIFTAGPLIVSLYYSFTHFGVLSSPKFCGLENYRQLFSDVLFQKALINTLYYTVGVVIPLIILSLVLAVVLNMRLKGYLLFRTLYFLPVVTSTIAISLLWRWIYDTNLGLINYILSILQLSPIDWLGSTTWAMPSIILMSIWKGLGYNIVLYMAGLQSVPSQLYEAATIDGASEWQKFIRITIPLISPTTFFILIMSIISSFQVFEQTYVMTRGGPVYSTTTLVYYIYLNGFQWFKMGYASSIAWVLFSIILIITIIQWIFQKKWVFYYGA